MAPKKSQKTTHPGAPSTSSSRSSQPWKDYGIKIVSNEEKARFLAIQHKPILSTRFAHWPTLFNLGIHRDVSLLFERLGWEGFRNNAQPTYVDLVLEFLSTLEVSQEEGGTDAHGQATLVATKVVTFRLLNKSFKKTFAELNLAWGFDSGSPLSDERGEGGYAFRDQEVWLTLTNQSPYISRKAKSSRIIHPAIRYMHRCVMYAIYGRTELGNMHSKDAGFLNLLIGQKRHPTPINFAEELIEQCLKFRAGKEPNEKFLMGGMITILAQRVFGPNLDLHNHDYVDQDYFLEIKELERMGMIKTQGDIFSYRVFNEHYCFLPRDDIALTRQAVNPYVFPTAQEEQQVEPPPPVVPSDPTPGEASSSSSSFDFTSLQNQMSYMQSEMEANSYYSRALYHNEVRRGHIDPYVNFPYHPPQAGPIPGWNNEQPTYPYWPIREEGVGYDYRQPGGSNPFYDPNIPPFYGGVTPPGYHERVDLLDSFQGNLPEGFSYNPETDKQ